jgi:YidC/Oxa1 family membrane protein insertase
MSIIDITLGAFFGLLMRLCHLITGHFGRTILAFTLLTKVVLFPISLISQKNAIIMVKIRPLLADLQARHEGDLETLLKEQKLLYRKEKYSAWKAILPLLIQIPLIIGVISVINDPVRHIGHAVDPLFWGVDLLKTPDTALIPLLAIISVLLLCVTQNRYNVLSREQGFLGRWGVTLFLTLFTGWFVFACPAGVGLYWTFSNLLGIVILAVCNLIYNPGKYIDREARTVKPKLTKTEKTVKRERKIREKIREKEDMKRFEAAKKELVFYSEASGFYKYFSHFIRYILDHSDITVHYLTSDSEDQVFGIDTPRFQTYFCSGHGLITAFMKMNADIVVMTMPDLEVYHYKRSLIRKDIEYIYTHHGEGSFHLMIRKSALDHFDTIFCYSRNHNEEIRAMERVYGLPEKKLVNVGFGLLDKLIEEYGNTEQTIHETPQILIAPSWQKDNILEYCLEPLLDGLAPLGAQIIIRPHPEFVKRFAGKWKQISDRYQNSVNVITEADFSSNATVYQSDLVITDWSTIAQEFSFTTKKPSLFINTPMKVMNPEWKRIGIEPMDIWIRDKIGFSLDVDQLGAITYKIRELMTNKATYQAAIEQLLTEHMYHLGQTAQVGGEYIIGQIRAGRKPK